MFGGNSDHVHLINPKSRPVLMFRWIVFLLAAGYMIYRIVLDADYQMPGGPFRFLTIWALCLSFFVASRQLAFSEGRSSLLWSRTVMVTCVLNALVVAIYWRLFLTNPSLVNSNGPPVWYLEYYLHLVGPLLQWIDALVIFGAFQRWWRAVPGLIVAFFAYVLWIELFVSPNNDFPVGPDATGFPYPFLNAMTFDERAAFYAMTAVQMIGVLIAFAALAWVIRRLMTRSVPSQEAP